MDKKQNHFFRNIIALIILFIIFTYTAFSQFCAWPYPKNLLAIAFWVAMVFFIAVMMRNQIKNVKKQVSLPSSREDSCNCRAGSYTRDLNSP